MPWTHDFIPVASPSLSGNEVEYVMDCLTSTWISSNGKYIPLFETRFAEFTQTKHAISCSNGTAALHLALLSLGIGPGDEVIVPTLTYIATANAVMYCGAKPVMVDSESHTWNLDPHCVEMAITAKTKAIIVVHLYGHPAEMDQIQEIARQHNLYIIEDAAEAHGATYKGRKIGSIGELSTFSFYGNKIITTGEGGMICTNRDDLALHIRQLKGQGQDPNQRYWFPIIGYNYRMTNIQAAIGAAQLENIDWHIDQRRHVASWYRECLKDSPEIAFSPELPGVTSVYWLSSIVLANSHPPRDLVAHELLKAGVETRPFFYPLHTMPPYRPLASGRFPVAESLAARGLNLPSFSAMSQSQVVYIVDQLTRILAS